MLGDYNISDPPHCVQGPDSGCYFDESLDSLKNLAIRREAYLDSVCWLRRTWGTRMMHAPSPHYADLDSSVDPASEARVREQVRCRSESLAGGPRHSVFGMKLLWMGKPRHMELYLQ